MILKCMHLLFVAVSCTQLGLVALPDLVKFTSNLMELVIKLGERSFSTFKIQIELPGATTFGFLLTHELSLGFSMELIALRSGLAVLL